MTSSFILLGLVAFLYYLDVRKDSVIDVRSEMLKALYYIRENPAYETEKFDVFITSPEGYVAPSFKEYPDRFELVACANPHHQNSVYVITAPITLAKEHLNAITNKILTAYLLLFIPFFFFGYLLARVALIPLKNSYDSLVSFNQDIIHDLKTPITTIQINGELLDKKIKPFSRVINATKTLESLYLNLESYLRTGKHLKFEKVDLQALLDEKKEVYASLYPHAEFLYEIDSFYITTDVFNFIRILDNIIANGIKHGARIPEIKIRAQKHALFISDNGAGIAHPEKIFERHYCEVQYVKGFGLGLNIVKRLSEQLNIPIEVTTSKEGTTFKLDLGSIATI
jgi:signal transduction histidine kinase